LSKGWREFFADYRPQEPGAWAAGNGRSEGGRGDDGDAPDAKRGGDAATSASRRAVAPVPEGVEATRLRGAGARIVENMETSLGVPTATSVRDIPAKLLEVNRRSI